MNVRTHYVITSAVLAGLAAVWMVVQRPSMPGPSLLKPAAITRPAARVSPPTAREILQAEVLLELEPRQRTRLKALAAAWMKDSAALHAELDSATAEFSRFMDEARSRGRTDLREIQRRSVEIAELSAAVRARRRVHSDEAVAVLTAWQRTRLSGAARADVIGGER